MQRNDGLKRPSDEDLKAIMTPRGFAAAMRLRAGHRERSLKAHRDAMSGFERSGASNPAAKLSEADREAVRTRRDDGRDYFIGRLANEFGVSETTIRAVRGKRRGRRATKRRLTVRERVQAYQWLQAGRGVRFVVDGLSVSLGTGYKLRAEYRKIRDDNGGRIEDWNRVLEALL